MESELTKACGELRELIDTAFGEIEQLHPHFSMVELGSVATTALLSVVADMLYAATVRQMPNSNDCRAICVAGKAAMEKEIQRMLSAMAARN